MERGMNLKCETPGRTLVDNGFLALYAFETARDMLLGREPRLVRILTDADLLELSRLCPDATHGRTGGTEVRCGPAGPAARLVVTDFGAERVVKIPGITRHKRQIAMHAAPSAIFSVNCFFYDIEDSIFIDPLDRYDDLKQRRICTIERPENALEECSTLALKTARIAAETGFSIESNLLEFLGSPNSVPRGGMRGRVDGDLMDDFDAICVSGRAYEAFSLLDEWGILEQLLPELTALKDVHQDKDHHPEGNGFRHTMRTLKCVKKPDRNLILALLLHDTGKAVTSRTQKRARTFPDHSSASTAIADKILARFQIRAGDRDEILFLVQNHMILDAVKRLPKSRLRGIFGSPYFPGLLELYRADLQSGYHRVDNYYQAARMYKEFLRTERLNRQGVYAPGA
jgi:tRNA nucleotidyltransferase/poly(A) polymerase